MPDESSSITDRIFTTTGVIVVDGVVSHVEIPPDPLSSDPTKAFGPMWLRVDGPTMMTMVKALEQIASTKYGLQGLYEDGASDAEIASYWSDLASRYQRAAQRALEIFKNTNR